MMRALKLIIASTLVMVGSQLVFATNKNVGTSAAQFLKIGAGARPTAMGDSFVAVSEDVNSVTFNPAGIADVARPEFAAMHTQWIADANYDFGAFCYPTNHGALAFAASTLKVEDIQRRGSDETHNGDFKAMDAAYALSYGHNLTPLTSLGVTARYISQSIDAASAGTWAGDVGVIKRLQEKPVSLGLAVKNFGQAVEFRNESDPLPLMVDAGVATTFLRQNLLVTADGRWFRDNDPGFGVGLEYRHDIGSKNRFALRTGYNSTVTDAGAAGLTLGGGLGFGRLDLDFAWVPFGDFGNTFRYAAHMKF